jgi:diguanylate cyclase (GGDEF)-like protein
VVFTRLTLGPSSVDPTRYISTEYASNSLVARYSTLTFAQEHSTLFRYRLKPLFGDWRETAQSELQFPGLPPNDYRLEVEARRGWDLWDQQPAVFAFAIRPPWWRTWWFVALLGMIPPVLVLLVSRQWHLRQERIRRELERLVAQRTAELDAARKQAELLATIDPLTGILNRRGFFERAERDLQIAHRRRSPIAVAIFDLDHFKRVNDTCGHAEGDRVLREAALVAKNSIRTTDLLGRIGGEEFMVVMPDTRPEDAVQVADRIRVTLSTMVFTGKPPQCITASFGIAGSATGYASMDGLQSVADKALYRAKNNGRNRVEVVIGEEQVVAEVVRR